jgi:transmembrane sensor
MVANRIWILIGKKVSAEATPHELEELQSLVADSGDSIHTITGLEEMWRTVNIESIHKSEMEIDERWERFKHKLEPQAHVIPLRKRSKQTYFWLLQF